jgi:hypothetical protein
MTVLPAPVFILMVLLRRSRFANHPSRTSACSSDGRLKRGFRGRVVKILRGSIRAAPVILDQSFERSRTILECAPYGVMLGEL